MTEELSPRYDPQAVEPRWIQAWEDQEVGRADPESEAARAGRVFTVMIPPPNVTGVLHMGHALNNTLQDVVVRLHRMKGFETLWVPGTDHAGIATQAVVERKLASEGVKREDIGREAFLDECWKWKDEHGGTILSQLRRLGASCDWSRTRFTLSDELSHAVRVSFVRLWKKGLISRGARIVNWDCALGTAVNDDEVEYKEAQGNLWYLRYPASDGSGAFVEVATTRPETMLGDTGVAVHPDDERYRDLVGKTVTLPLMDREIPVVADESVDPKFGTGAVKVTPGHDPADYERGARHRLPIINILNLDGTLNENAGKFAGMTREAARKQVLAEMAALGLHDKVEPITQNVPISDRSKTAIEPLVSEQWWVRMSDLAGPAIAAVKSDALVIRPARWTKVYLQWLENVQDWCISRQLWWGHRIPVWYDEDGEPAASIEDLEIGAPHPVSGKPIVRQDDDVLDTWASSWLWPFATLGWPEHSKDLGAFYPTQFLSTGRDIIYLWVARMVMAGYEFLDHLPEAERCPFAVCYIHANVLDAIGRRMSKSLGNGIDPRDIMSQYGADAMRFTLVWMTTEGQDVKLDPQRFEMGRNFMNKIWNAARFTLGVVGDTQPSSAEPVEAEDRWIRSELTRTTADVTAALEGYHFNVAAQAIHEFVWHGFCDWYLELVKARMRAEGESADRAKATLLHVLTGMCRLLHPIAPHISEEIWSRLPGDRGLLARADWGAETFLDPEATAGITAVQEVIRAVRNLRAESRVPAKETVDVVIRPFADAGAAADALLANSHHILSLAKVSGITLEVGAEPPAENASAVLPFAEVFVDLEGKIDRTAERARLTKEREKAAKALDGSDRKLANENFVSRAAAEVVERERAKNEELRAQLARLDENLGRL